MQPITRKEISQVRVSSVLNKDVKNFGKNNIFDDCPDSCWNSDEGKPQWVTVEFSEPLNISAFNIEFQGGFVGQNCKVEMDEGGEAVNETFYPEDVNGVQKFTLSQCRTTKFLKFLFNESSDFFGRIVIYSITIFKE